MTNRATIAGLILSLALSAAPVSAAPESQTAFPAATVAAHPDQPCQCVVIPALTPVSIELRIAVGSKISKTGDTFPIRLAAPIVVNGTELLPAGATGVGEIVHAKKSLNSGAAGELVAAARYIQIGDKRLKLRSLQLVTRGGDRIESNQLRSQIGLFSYLFVKVDPKDPDINLEAGTVAMAKTAEAFTIEIGSTPDGANRTAAPSPGNSVNPTSQPQTLVE